MKYIKIKKITGALAITAAVANLLLAAFRVYSFLVMWIVIVILAIIAFPGINWLNEKAAEHLRSDKARKTKKGK